MITPEGLRQTRRGLGGQLADLRKAAGFTQHAASRRHLRLAQQHRRHRDGSAERRPGLLDPRRPSHPRGRCASRRRRSPPRPPESRRRRRRAEWQLPVGLAIEPLHQSRPGHVDGPCPAAPFMGTSVFGGELPLIEVTDHGLDQIHALTTPSGRFFNGSAIAAGFVRGVDDGRVLAEAGLDVADTALNRTGSSSP